MNDPWIPILANLPLSRTEREVAKRFEADPSGRTFLPVADILRTHRLIDESLELLTQGVERHATFTVARVVLARELLAKGLIEIAWRTLASSPVSLVENILAQKLRFRLSILLGMEPEARATYQHMLAHQMVDGDTKRVAELLDVTGFGAARDKLIKDLRDRGTEPVIPEPAAPNAAANAPQPDDLRMAVAGATAAQPRAVSAYLDGEKLDDDQGLSGFHVVPLDEIFRPTGESPGATDMSRGAPGADGVELDSTTLADIYAHQGHYGKALAVYRRLLRLTPGNELIRRKVGDLSKLDRDQRDVDLTVDPALVDRMETVEIIDRQIRFYNDLLTKLI